LVVGAANRRLHFIIGTLSTLLEHIRGCESFSIIVKEP
jgi:hypothetical protein